MGVAAHCETRRTVLKEDSVTTIHSNLIYKHNRARLSNDQKIWPFVSGNDLSRTAWEHKSESETQSLLLLSFKNPTICKISFELVP